MVADPVAVALRVAQIFEACGVRYLVGGSLAGAICGEPRSTLDVDLVAAVDEKRMRALIADLGGEFHFDVEALLRAVREKSSADLIHLHTSTRVRLFVLGGTPLDSEQMARRRRVRLASDPDRFLYVYTPEDILLQKLRWYRLGHGESDRQWRDILGIALVQGRSMDEPYLRDRAGRIGVADLLDRALGEARDR